MIWTQPELNPGSTRFSSLNESSPFSCSHRVARHRIEGHAEAVAQAVGEDLLDVRADLAADRRAGGEERIVRGRRAVVVQPQDHAGQVRVVRLRAAELIVRHASGPPGPSTQVLQLAAPAVVADRRRRACRRGRSGSRRRCDCRAPAAPRRPVLAASARRRSGTRAA